MCVVVSLLRGEASALCFFWNEEEEEEEEEEKKMMRNRQKERSQKNFSELMNQLHYTHTCEHIIRETQISFFCSIILAQIFPHRETTSVSNATSCTVRVNTLERKSTVQTRVNKKFVVVKNEKNQSPVFLVCNKTTKNTKKEKKANKQTHANVLVIREIVI